MVIEKLNSIVGKEITREDLIALETSARKNQFLILANNLNRLLESDSVVEKFVITSISKQNYLKSSLGNLDTAKTKSARKNQLKAVFAKLSTQKKLWPKNHSGKRIEKKSNTDRPTKGQIIFDSKRKKSGTILKVYKPTKGSALENEPFLMDIKYDDGKAINMPMSDRFTMANTVATKINKKGQYSLFGTAGSQESIVFNKQILLAKKRGLPINRSFGMGKSKGELKKNIGDFTMSISSDVIKKSMSKDNAHIAEWHHFINLPDTINNPVAIFKSKTEGFVVLTEIKNQKEKPLMLAVHVSDTFKILKVASIYSKTNVSIYKQWIKDGDLVYGNKKSGLFNWITAPIAASSKSPLRSKDTKSSLNGQNDSLPSIFQRPGEQVEKKNVFQLGGEIGRLLGELQKYRLAILLKGDTHAGKSEVFWQIINELASHGFKPAIFDFEQGGLESEHTRAAIQRNVSADNQKILAVTGEAPEGIETIRKYASMFDVIALDSFQKLGVPNTVLDALRIEFPDTIFLTIFQQNGEGGTRGGVSADFDAPVVLKVHKVDSTFVNNYVEVLKNRGNAVGGKYNVYKKKIIVDKPAEETKKK